MDQQDWQIIKTLYEEKSLTKTAAKLYLSQPALSYRLDHLEKEMNVPLFIRSTKGIRFTSAGERMVTCAEKMLREYEDIKKYVAKQDGVISGMLRLGASAVFAHSQLPALLKEFLQKYPAVEVSLHTGLSNNILRQLHRSELSVAIIRGDHPWNEGDILLQTEPLCIISAKPLAIEELPNIPGIKYATDSTMQYQIDRWWQEHFSVPPKILMHADSVYTCRQLVLAGLGWSIMPALRLPDHTDNLSVIEIADRENEPYLRPTRMIYRDSARELDAVNTFIEFISAKYKPEA